MLLSTISTDLYPINALSFLLAPYTESEFVLLGDLNCEMLKSPEKVLKQWNSLNLSQIITNPTRYDSKTPTNSP